jgi:hypothetical protein
MRGTNGRRRATGAIVLAVSVVLILVTTGCVDPFTGLPIQPTPGGSTSPPTPGNDTGTNHVVARGWDPGTEGWSAVAGTVSHASGAGRRGYTNGAQTDGALRFEQNRSGGWAGQIVHQTPAPEDTGSRGPDLRTYVRVDPSSPAGSYTARIAVSDQSYQWSFGPTQTLEPGQWVQVNYHGVPSTFLRNKRSYAISLDSSDVTGKVVYQVDDYLHGTFSGTGSTTTTPTTTTAPSPTTPPSTTSPPADGDACAASVGTDPVQRQHLHLARQWRTWLGSEKGWIGESGWPKADARWKAMAEKVYACWDQENQSMSTWFATELIGCSTANDSNTRMTAYQCTDGNGGVLNRRNANIADVVERFSAERAGVWRGINHLGYEYGVGANLGTGNGGPFSNANPGTYGTHYSFDSTASLQYLASRGVKTVRFPMRWERMQPDLGGGLNATEMARVIDYIDRAAAVGIKVIPSLFNYGGYWLHDPSCNCGRVQGLDQPGSVVTGQKLANFWKLFAQATSSKSTIVGFGIMGEPVNAATWQSWEAASQAVVSAVRSLPASQGGDRQIFVDTYGYAHPAKISVNGTCMWTPCYHPNGPWINDPLKRTVYSAHHYFADDPDGGYDYDVETGNARARGF